MSTTTNYKATPGDTVQKVAAMAGVSPAEILALNRDLKPTSKLVVNRIYQLPTNAASNSMVAVNDLVVEIHARKSENSQTG